LPAGRRPEGSPSGNGAPHVDAPLPPNGVNLEELDRSFVEKALQQAKGNKSKAARLLGLTRSQLYSRLDKYQIGKQPD
jgi:DNA-binding NtrC family response regulator